MIHPPEHDESQSAGRGNYRIRVRNICREKGVDIIRGGLSADHIHMFVSAPPKLVICELVRLVKGRSSHKVQRAFPQSGRRYWAGAFGPRVFLNDQRCHPRPDRVTYPRR